MAGKKYRYKLLASKHTDKEGPPAKDDKEQRGTIRKFVKGDVFETDKDLDKMFNHPGMNKFERVDDDTKLTASGQDGVEVDSKQPARDDGKRLGNQLNPNLPPTKPAVQIRDAEYTTKLEKMNVKELQDHAAEEEVDLKGATTKADIIKRLLSA